MAKETITAQFQLQASFDTLQAIRHTLADEATRQLLISRLSEIVTGTLPDQHFQMQTMLRVSAPVNVRRGPRSPLPTVENGLMTWFDDHAQITNTVGPVGSAHTATWLAQEWSRSFRYQSDLGSFTAIKEIRRGRPVWYAHRRHKGQLKRVYLGLSQNLTLAKLDQAVRKLNSFFDQ